MRPFPYIHASAIKQLELFHQPERFYARARRKWLARRRLLIQMIDVQNARATTTTGLKPQAPYPLKKIHLIETIATEGGGIHDDY